MGAACSCMSDNQAQQSAAAAPQPAPAAPAGTATVAPAVSGSTAGAATAATATTTTVKVASVATPNTSTDGIVITDAPAVAALSKAAPVAATADYTHTAAPTATGSSDRAKIAVVYYSTWGHLRALAEAIVKGALAGGADVTLYQIAETLPPEVLQKMYAPGQPTDVPLMTAQLMPQFDGFIFGAPTRYGQPAAQYKALWDNTGQLWQQGALDGKLAGFFFGTASLGGGQEVTASTNLSHFVHHGMLFVPMGYGDPDKPLFDLDTVHGGSPWGAGTLSAADGSRKVSGMELGMAQYQGKRFATFANQFVKGRAVQ